MATRVADMPRLLITRPVADAAPLATKARDAGFSPVLAPMLEIVIDPARPDFAEGGALAFTSANGVRAAGPPPKAWSGPVFAVGPTTAESARRAGWPQVESADGDVRSLAATVASRRDSFAGPVLHVGGRDGAGDLVALLAGFGVAARKIVVYEAIAPARLPDAAAAFLGAAGPQDWVSFFSPRTAEIFVRLVADAALTDLLEMVGAAVLSDAVAAAARRGGAWRAVAVADKPTEDALLARLVRIDRPPA